MSATRRPWNNAHARKAHVRVLFALCLGTTICTAQSNTTLPSVIGASVPFYPRIAQQAHILGVVRLRVSTDGKQASSVEVESGPPMLAKAATDNVKTWQFEQHTPTGFETIFRYSLLPSTCDAKCNCGSGKADEVLLHLPAEVEVSAKEVFVCHRVREGPLVVKLTVKHDGKDEPPPDQVTISFDSHSAQLPVRDGSFEVPPEFVKADEVTFAAEVGGDHIRITNLRGTMFSMEDWTLVLAERRFDEDHRWVIPKGTDVRSSCILEFESQDADPGIEVFDPNCRSKRR